MNAMSLELSSSDEEMEITGMILDKIVPSVPYEDWNCFVECVYTTLRSFNALVSESVLLENSLQNTKKRGSAYNFASPGNPKLPAFDDHSFAFLSRNAPSVLANLTRGEECVFTRLVAKQLLRECSRVVWAYTDTIYFHSCYNSDHPDGCDKYHLEFDYEHLRDLMRSSVQHSFSGLAPFNTCFRFGFVAALLSKNFCIMDCNTRTVMSVSQYNMFLLTLCMGLHNRLGAGSLLSSLDDEVLRQITASLLMPRDSALSVFAEHEKWLC